MSFLSRRVTVFAFVANECTDATRGSFEDREVLLSVVALWEAEDGSRFVSFCIFLLIGLGVAFMSRLRYNVAKIVLLERKS